MPTSARIRDRRQEDHWAVNGWWRNGESVITIESNCLAGRTLLPGDEDAIRIAARNLLSFIGARPEER